MLMYTKEWYPVLAERGPNQAQLKVLPVFETGGEGFSVDVLVFGYVEELDKTRIPCYGIGYVDRNGAWYVYTVNGTYPNDDVPAEFIPLMWQYLPTNYPCDPYRVKNKPVSEDIAPQSNTEKGADAMTTPYTGLLSWVFTD